MTIGIQKSGKIGLKLDSQGGAVPMPGNKAAAKKVDFITLPEAVSGTNCLNCRFVSSADGQGKRFCKHPEVSVSVKQPVTDRNCCAEWDAKGTKRDF
jgi:hypothetical protein